MTQGYVIFNDMAAFDVLHDAENIAAGLPKVGYVCEIPAPQNVGTINITSATEHPDVGDNRVIAYINGGWRDSAKTGFEFKTKEEAQALGWFPIEGE